ncbi:hypothetical protein GCM10007108_15260 [Thermogymnomonas acidicola]|uniref:Blue (type 1) copper domain-containing protein n=1 Tax=Thermogymnomonas acidicola TaxID=399579 RepID=A0AA37FA21_9ARCH|nr:cupredoxin domain-containing protein [Thermogymnomonas acidicola]GGM78047.1 hypothetical protein GCM10007108_15260 [Thermogymnomonas acidicola]
MAKPGLVFAVTVVVVVALAISFIATAPQAGGRPFNPNDYKYTVDVTIWADAAGWNYNHGVVNPTLYFKPGTKVVFTVIEEDGLPHTLTINPGKTENRGNAYTVLSIAQITQTIGHKSTGIYVFDKTGYYTYWCTVHPTTMVALIVITDNPPYIGLPPSNNTTSSSVVTDYSIVNSSNSINCGCSYTQDMITSDIVHLVSRT